MHSIHALPYSYHHSMKATSLCYLTALALSLNAQAVVIQENFESITTGSDLNGKKGWVVNDTGHPELATVQQWGAYGSGKAAFLGFPFVDGELNYMPTLPTVNLTHTYGEQMVGIGHPGTSATFSFAIMDSTISYPNHDTFGVALTTTVGATVTNIFSVAFVPYYRQPGSVWEGVWTVHYTVGSESEVQTGWGLQSGNYLNDFDLSFSAAGSVTSYSLTINDGHWTGTTAFAPSQVIDTFGVSWTPLKDPTLYPDQAGDNGFIFDNLTVVPEPSSALLLGLAGLGLVSRRRRV